jgi:hypothetical protein
MRNAYKILVGKPEGKRSLGRPARGWEHNIIMAVTEIGWEGVDCMYLPQDRDQCQGSCEHGNDPSGSIKDVECVELPKKDSA